MVRYHPLPGILLSLASFPLCSRSHQGAWWGIPIVTVSFAMLPTLSRSAALRKGSYKKGSIRE